jgi:hypothetical protein
MSEVESFGNIVNSLRSVRDNYNEQLKAVPQYGAFLLVESSTQHVTDTLQGVTGMAPEVVAALESAKIKFREHLTSVAEYRALLAIDKLIGDLAADLGIQPAAPAVVEPQPEPAVATVEPAPEVVHAEQGVAEEVVAQEVPAQEVVAQQEIVEPVQAPTEIAAQAESVEPAPVEAISQAATEPELTSAEAISQLQSALQSTETVAELSQPALAEPEPVASATAELPPVTPLPEAQSIAPTEPAVVSHEEEKAA